MPAGPLPDPAEVMTVLRYWTFLLDRDRVWAPQFLETAPRR
jgi:hypothetical protein